MQNSSYIFKVVNMHDTKSPKACLTLAVRSQHCYICVTPLFHAAKYFLSFCSFSSAKTIRKNSLCWLFYFNKMFPNLYTHCNNNTLHRMLWVAKMMQSCCKLVLLRAAWCCDLCYMKERNTQVVLVFIFTCMRFKQFWVKSKPIMMENVLRGGNYTQHIETTYDCTF